MCEESGGGEETTGGWLGTGELAAEPPLLTSAGRGREKERETRVIKHSLPPPSVPPFLSLSLSLTSSSPYMSST